MKKLSKILIAVLAISVLVGACFAFTACNDEKDTIVVFTNAFFAPFEYMEGEEIKGVDIDIMKMVAEDMGKEIKFENKEFDILINEVQSGKLCDAAAAGITITEERAEKVDFSIPYYTANQFVIFEKGALNVSDYNGQDIVYWDDLAGKTIGTQTDTTGWIYADAEINEGALAGTDTELKTYADGQLATDAIIAGQIDVVIIDELPAQYFTSSRDQLTCLPLYYSAVEDDPNTEEDESAEAAPTTEQYAIAVNKNQTELKAAINKVLEELLATVDANGKNGIEVLVEKHFGLNK